MFKSSLRCMSKSGDTLVGKTVGEATSHFKSSKTPFVENIIENQSYKSFFADFDKETKGKRITSFEEQKSFNQMLQFLTQTQNRDVIDSIKTEFGQNGNAYDHTNVELTGSSSPRKYSFFGKKTHPINLEMRHKQRMEQRKLMETALEPTFNYLNNNIENSKMMYDFIINEIITVFINSNDKVGSLEMDSIKSQCDTMPGSPPITKETLPYLLHFCLRSLINDFHAFELVQSVIHLIKTHPNIDLYSQGMNTDVYNLLIFETWKQTGDLHSISVLVDELRANALPHDLETYKLIALIYLRCFAVGKSVAVDSIIWSKRSDIYSLKNYLDSVVVL